MSAGAMLAMALASVPVAHANAANADITAPLRAAQGGQPAADNGDQAFRQLFASWRAVENGSLSSTVPGFSAHAVSIPSRMPVEGVHLTSDFGMRWHPILGGRREHKGVDLAGPVGTPVHATADGTVARADWFSGYGLYIQLEHGGNLETRYGHMSRLNVAAGQYVHKGDVIGYIGTTGRTTGPHLHYEVRIDGVAVNPVPYMQGEGSGQLPSGADAVSAVQAGPAEADGDD
ncbi:MAG TPA: M23 family metallopeptidase [Novosphingobium sp.]|nr:M23 family metallopeptidase [Novosphingobium sp.]